MLPQYRPPMAQQSCVNFLIIVKHVSPTTLIALPKKLRVLYTEMLITELHIGEEN